MQYFSIGSGSSGNCAYIGGVSANILLDAGISGKRTREALESMDISPEEIDGILITHEHADHVSCLGVLSRKYHIPIYAVNPTIEEIQKMDFLGEIDSSLFRRIEVGKTFSIGDIDILPIGICHDAIAPVGYKFFQDDKTLAIITDLGCYDESLIDLLKNLDGIVIEANHDPAMLEAGIYPYHLKRRIASENGHLSNEDCGQILSKVVHDNLSFIVLAHLSAENNYDRLALESVGLEISLAPNKYRAKDFTMYIAPRKTTGELFTI